MNDVTTSVRVERRGRVGRLTLARPEALNALDADMIDALAGGLAAHVADPAVEFVVIDSSDARAFCAGGDMKRARALVLAGRADDMDAFFAAEYALNLAIADCPKPYVALIDGIAMGGGMGVSVHGSHRVVTERATLAMPETRIGLFPDVGASHFLPRLPADAGRWLGLSGESVDADTALACGLATHRVRAATLPDLVDRLEDRTAGTLDDVLAASAEPARVDPALVERLARRAEWFAADTAADIDATLADAARSSDDARHLLGVLRAASPYAVDTTLELLRGSMSRTLAEALERERAAARDAVRHPDFVEGIRSVLVDRERGKRPAWVPR